jgi:hypothetical protein
MGDKALFQICSNFCFYVTKGRLNFHQCCLKLSVLWWALKLSSIQRSWKECKHPDIQLGTCWECHAPFETSVLWLVHYLKNRLSWNWRESVTCHTYQENFGVEYSIFLPLFLQKITLSQHQWKTTFCFLYLVTFSDCKISHLYHTCK